VDVLNTGVDVVVVIGLPNLVSKVWAMLEGRH
jgi:hypothetical protein